MGLKHIYKVKTYLMCNQDWLSKTHIRDKLSIDSNTLQEVLSFLHSEGKIQIRELDRVRYKWIGGKDKSLKNQKTTK